MFSRRFILAGTAALAALPAGGAKARQEDDIMSHILGQPSLAWSVYGLRRPARARSAPEVPGGQAVRVQAPQTANPWDIGASLPVDGDINAGDVVLLAVWLRAETPPDGQTTVRLNSVGIQQSSAPYQPVITGAVTLTSEWKMLFVSGTAAEARPKGAANVNLQLGGSAQTVDLGPAFVFNLGHGYDQSRLPRNE